MKIEREVKINACGILTLKQCRALRQCDEHGLADLRDHIFEDLDAKGFAIEARGASAGTSFSRRAHGRRVSTRIRARGSDVMELTGSAEAPAQRGEAAARAPGIGSVTPF